MELENKKLKNRLEEARIDFSYLSNNIIKNSN